MEYRLLGKTGLNVSVIGMGCEGFSEDHYRMTGRMFDAAEELGISLKTLYNKLNQLQDIAKKTD